MDFGFDVITEEEYERQRALYGPLTEAVRRLIYASLHTEIDADTVEEAQAKIEAVAEILESKQRSSVQVVHEETGRPLAWANPAVGLRNAIAPPMMIHHEDDGRCWSEFTLSGAYEGPPGWVHGGICALVLDHLLGEAASEGLTKPKFTGTISLRYLRGTPLGELRAEAYVERVEGVKTFARGYLLDAEGPTVEAEGVFIQPAWARDAG
ncbi:PaaI family thioesterase [Mycobacterium sp. E136]|uniref:PaaI family thioesterase n=1 Tax=Mycobacterium sp. E136 TaxID=1834125 RepID=UPI0018D4659D|nr:PaaI family thioesterase [Mycobacterium sp. E136]